MQNKKTSSPPAPAWHRLAPAVLLLLTLLLFSSIRQHEFINYDDNHYITESPEVLRGLSWSGMKTVFTEPHFFMWHPLTTLSHQLDVTLFGLDPGAHHLMNALIHAVNAALLFILLRTMTGTFWRALIVAALFAWHPLRVESVAWASERKDTLSTLFWLLTLLAYARYASKPNGKSYALVIASFALGIMTKPLIVTLPCVLLLLDIWPLKRLPAEALASLTAWKQHWPTLLKLGKEKLPLFILSGLLSVLTWQAQSSGGIIRTTDQFSIAERLSNAVVGYARYLGKLVWPQDLVVFYPHPGQWAWPLVIGAGLIVAGISLWVIRRRGTHPWELVGWLWFLGVLFPAIGVVQSGGQSMADRYSYVSCIGILIAVIWTGEVVSRQKGWRNAGLILTVFLPLLGYIWLTRVQLSYWRNSETLFRHVLAASPGNVVGYENLGSALMARGKVEEAAAVMIEGLTVHPGRPNLHNNLGLAYRSLGQPKAAIEQYQLALRSKPAFAGALNNLGNILRESGDIAGAIRELEEALKLEPNDSETMNNLALAYEEAGRKLEAGPMYQAAIKANPGNVEAHVNLATLLLELGRKEEAVDMSRKAVSLRPDFLEANAALFIALAGSGKLTEAREAAAQALRLAHAQNRPDMVRTLEAELARYGLRP